MNYNLSVVRLKVGDCVVMPMKKNIYSLVLSDQVIQEADRQAAKRGMSRSAFIDSLLAEALNCLTPEQQRQAVFDQMRQLMKDRMFQIGEAASSGMLSMRTVLQYRYKPAVRYSVLLYRGDGSKREDGHPAAAGELRVSLRSQNNGLMTVLNGFFDLWIYLEEKRLTECMRSSQWGIALLPAQWWEDGRYYREFCPPESLASDHVALGESIGRYVLLLDHVMRRYVEVIQTTGSQEISREVAGKTYLSEISEEPLFI